MIYAIGLPGAPVRCFIETEDITRAAMQLQAGEVGLQVESVQRWATIGQDGLSIIIDDEPLRFSQDSIRLRRNALLSSCDWTVIPDSPMTAGKRAEWIAYRQQLRDITSTQPTATLDTIVWPNQPGAE